MGNNVFPFCLLLDVTVMGKTFYSQVYISQPERVANDGYGTQAHGRACDDGAEQQAEERIKHARRDGDSERVIDERKEKILPDISHH
jgi:hypothetical protein